MWVKEIHFTASNLNSYYFFCVRGALSTNKNFIFLREWMLVFSSPFDSWKDFFSFTFFFLFAKRRSFLKEKLYYLAKREKMVIYEMKKRRVKTKGKIANHISLRINQPAKKSGWLRWKRFFLLTEARACGMFWLFIGSNYLFFPFLRWSVTVNCRRYE